MSVLSDEIDNDPTGKGYAAFLPDQPGHVVELLNEQTETMVKSRMITARGIMSDYPGGAALAAGVLDKLEAAAASIPALKSCQRSPTQQLHLHSSRSRPPSSR